MRKPSSCARQGQPAKLSFGAHALMENQSGILIDLMRITDSTLYEPRAACPLVDRRRHARQKMTILGADNKAFIAKLRNRKMAPHIAQIEGRDAPGLDGRTTRHECYAISQRRRKRIEEIFGSIKTVGGLRKARFIGIAKTQLAAYWSACCAWLACSRPRHSWEHSDHHDQIQP